jgi:uncharacterized protein involved in outer membrane biogenesis
MKKTLKILAYLGAGVILIFIGLSIFVSTLDADKYRLQLVDVIGKQTGRVTKLNGPISFSLGLSGVHIAIQDASLGNPVWASRPNMAGMGKFELSLGLLPLLTHHISINELLIENADILLESNSFGQNNWNFAGTTKSASPEAPTQAQAPVSSSSSSSESVSVHKLSIINSQLAMRSADGKIFSFNVSNMILTMESSGANLTFNGDVNGSPLILKLKTGITNLMSRSDFPFDADVTFSNFQLMAKGDADIAHSKADISSYVLTSGKTSIKGDAKATWGGARPTLHGSLNSDRIDLADFKTQSSSPSDNAQATTSTTSSTSKRMFSDALLPLSNLKIVDAERRAHADFSKVVLGQW